MDFHNLIGLHVELLILLLLRHAKSIGKRILGFVAVRLASVLLLDQDQVTLGNLYLLILERQFNAHILLLTLQEVALSVAIVVVINVVPNCILQSVHLSADLQVLVPK